MFYSPNKKKNEMTDSELHWMRVRDKHQAKMEEWRNRYPKGNMDNLSKETREELTIAIKEILEKEKLEDEQESKLTKTFEKSDNRNDVKGLDE